MKKSVKNTACKPDVDKDKADDQQVFRTKVDCFHPDFVAVFMQKAQAAVLSKTVPANKSEGITKCTKDGGQPHTPRPGTVNKLDGDSVCVGLPQLVGGEIEDAEISYANKILIGILNDDPKYTTFLANMVSIACWNSLCDDDKCGPLVTRIAVATTEAFVAAANPPEKGWFVEAIEKQHALPWLMKSGIQVAVPAKDKDLSFKEIYSMHSKSAINRGGKNKYHQRPTQSVADEIERINKIRNISKLAPSLAKYLADEFCENAITGRIQVVDNPIAPPSEVDGKKLKLSGVLNLDDLSGVKSVFDQWWEVIKPRLEATIVLATSEQEYLIKKYGGNSKAKNKGKHAMAFFIRDCRRALKYFAAKAYSKS